MLPHVVDGTLYVDGTKVPGTWWSVKPAGDAWIAVEGMPLTWWWGQGAEKNELPNGEDVTPKISPDGRYVAVVRAENRKGILTVFDTRTAQNALGTPAHFGEVRPEEGAYVTAVTDDGRVVIRRGDSFVVWSQDLVASTLSGQMVFDATPAGVVAGDVDGATTFLADISPKGAHLTRIGELPQHDDLSVSPGAAWIAWTPAGTTGGEVTSVPSLEVRTLDGSRETTLNAPDGWSFKIRTYAWEDDAYLVSTVTDDGGRERMARCSPESAQCVLAQTD